MSPGELEAKGFSSLQADKRRGSESDSSPSLAGNTTVFTFDHCYTYFAYPKYLDSVNPYCTYPKI